MSEKLSGNLVFLICFLATFFMLISLIPSGFLYSGKSYIGFDYPSYFDQSDIENIKYFRNGTLSTSSRTLTFDFTSEINFKIEAGWSALDNKIRFGHITWEWWVFWDSDLMDIEDIIPPALTKAHLIENWDSSFNTSEFYPVNCKHITVHIWFTDSNHTRNNIGDAWDDGSFDVGCGFGFDDAEATVSAWNIVGRLLTFQAIETGEGSIISNLISIAIWSSLSYLIYRLILLAIPFVG